MIEVIVALVILSAMLLVFYEFMASALNAAERVQRAATAYDRAQNALTLATSLNPMETPEGSFDVGAYRIRWRTARIGDVRRSTAYPTGKGRFAVALYRITLDFPDDPAFSPVEVTKLGYHLEALPADASGDAVR